jgi:hypothetical protein
LAIVVKRAASVKVFELIIPFTDIGGVSYPLIDVSFWTAIHNDWLTVPLIFDTGAQDVILKPDYGHVFPKGRPVRVGGIGQAAGHDAVEVRSDVELLGRRIDNCPVLIDEVPAPTLVGGVVGREAFKPFGFGFWENSGELYVVTLKS